MAQALPLRHRGTEGGGVQGPETIRKACFPFAAGGSTLLRREIAPPPGPWQCRCSMLVIIALLRRKRREP
jgi:hypothetical protein